MRLSVDDGVVVGRRSRGGVFHDGFLFPLRFPAHDLVVKVLEEPPDPGEGDLSLVGLGLLLWSCKTTSFGVSE